MARAVHINNQIPATPWILLSANEESLASSLGKQCCEVSTTSETDKYAEGMQWYCLLLATDTHVIHRPSECLGRVDQLIKRSCGLAIECNTISSIKMNVVKKSSFTYTPI